MQHVSRRQMLGLGVPHASRVFKASAPASSFADHTEASAREKIRQTHFPNVTLITQHGKPVRFYDDLIKDKIVTINFFFAECDEVCPLVTANLVKVQKLLGDRVGREIFMNSITLTPEKDSAAVIKDYADMHGVKPGWTFLTGKPEDIEHLRKSLGFTYPQTAIDKDKTQHIGNIRYGNEPLMLWAACPGMAHAEWIAESIGWVIRRNPPSPTS
jgi:protein SCO1/2